MVSNIEGFKGIKDAFLAYKNEEVIIHFPPQYIVGKQVRGEWVEINKRKEHEKVAVVLYEVVYEWMYSNPTGKFNLSLPHLAIDGDSGSTRQTYVELKKAQLVDG